jgi:hypothetical protein
MPGDQPGVDRLYFALIVRNVDLAAEGIHWEVSEFTQDAGDYCSAGSYFAGNKVED